MDFYGGSADVDLKALLELLKADDDPISVHQHVETLRQAISIADERRLQDFPTNGYITRLNEVLGHTIMMDFQVETKYAIMITFCTLMDIFPNTIGQMVREGLITTVSNVIQENMQYTDLADQAAKLCIKIAQETPEEMLNSSAIPTLMMVYDFCDSHAQRKVIEICFNCSRHCSSEEQFNEKVMPILQWIYPKVEMSRFMSDQKQSEKVAQIIDNMISATNNFYSPSKSFDKFTAIYDKMLEIGLIDRITSSVREYLAAISSAAENQEMQVDVVMDGGESSLINTNNNAGGGSPSKVHETTYTEQTISVLLSILSQGCKFSNLLIASLLHGGIVQVLTQLLPKEDMDQPAYINELTTLLNQLLPQTASDQQKMQKFIVFGPRQIYPFSKAADSQYQMLKASIESLEVQKRELYTSMSQDFFEFCASTLLQKLFVLYGEIIGHQFREKCITIIDKILSMLPNEVAHTKINPSSLAELVLQILASGTGQQVLVSLQISHRILSSNSTMFAIAFQRTGASQAITDMSEQTGKIEKYDKQAEEMAALEEMQNKAPSCRCCQPKITDMEARLGLMGRGLFGGQKYTEEETIEIITIEIEKIRSIMQISEGAMPQAKRDMLGIALKEKEIQLALLKEKQAAKLEGEKAKKLEDEPKVTESEEAKKAAEEGEASAAKTESVDAEKVEPAKISALIKEQSLKIVNDFIKNEAFLKQVSETNGDEIQLLTKFKQLGREILDESCSAVFNCQKTQALMDKLTDYLTQPHGMTTFEFAQSGILHALEIFLTKAPSLALIEREALRNQESQQNEETKRSEELILSAAQKQAKQQISQKEAKCLLLRIKVAAHALCLDKIGKFPLKELITQCHDVISCNEHILFEEAKDVKNQQDASEAIRNLHRREVIKVVYDPDGSLMEKAQRKALGLPQDDDFTVDDPEKQKQIELLSQPQLGSKAKSMALPFGHLGSNNNAAEVPDEEMEEEKSQVFQKRDRCFSVLGQVMLDVQYAENLWMVEERLKRVDTLNKAREYGQILDRNVLRGLVRTPEEAEDLAERFNQMADEETQDLLDRISNRLDEMLDEAHSQEQFEAMKPSFIEEFTEEICELATAQDMSEQNLQLFFDMLHLEMEDKIQEHEMGVAENEDANMDFLRPEHIKTLMLVKIKAFGNMIRETKDRTTELYLVKKQSAAAASSEQPKPVAADEPMQEEEKKQAIQPEEEKKDPGSSSSAGAASSAVVVNVNLEGAAGSGNASQAQTRIEFAEPPQISAHLSNDLIETVQDEPKAENIVEEVNDVEMTDEQQESSVADASEKLQVLQDESVDSKGAKKQLKRKARKMSEAAGLDDSKDKSLIDALNLHELIEKNNGVDSDLQFYFKGKLMPQNTCFYEIIQQAQKDRSKQLVKPQEMPKYDKSNPASLFKHLMASMHRGEQANNDQEKITIYFRCIDRTAAAQQQARKNSLLEFTANKRERTRSQAADLVSIHELNQVVQGLIDNEFSVFQHSVDDEVRFEDYFEKNQIERALKILKVLNFITTNTFLLSEKGLNFLLSRSESGSELDTLATKNMNLNVSLAGRGDIFYYYKLDANVLKSIQDPHKLVSGGLTGLLKEIFSSCSFLFHYETKLLYFKLVSFLGVDINRSLGYLRAYQKKRAANQQIYIPDQREERKGNTNEVQQKEEVSRDDIFADAMKIMDRLEKRKQLNIKFKDEAGIGLGPTYEFFTLLADQIYKAKDGKMWRIGQSDGTLFPAPIDVKQLSQAQLKEVSDLFRLAGTFIAKSIVDNKLIDLPISRLMWDLLLGKKLNLFDLREFDPFLFDILCELQQVANRKKEIDEMQCDVETKNRLLEGVKLPTHNTTVEGLGFYFNLPKYEDIELVRDGNNTQLVLNNVQEYIDLVLHSTFYDCVNLQLQAFKKGFNSVLPLDSIRTFSTKGEIEDMICGQTMDESEWKDLGKLKMAIKPDHGFNKESRCYNDFLRFIVEMEPEFRPKFIKWLTGSKRLPKGGFISMENQVSINRVADKVLRGISPDEQCPSVNTCQHYIKFPEYSSYDVLKRKFEQAIEMGADHFALA